MRDLSNLLWSDLTDDEERVAFLESGRAWETGIIAPVMVDEIMALAKNQGFISNWIYQR